MTDVTLLRKLADKSKFGYGKYSDLSVRDVLNLGHPNYIRWCYFNSDKISFLDSILDEVRIPEEYRIQKPGKNPELGEKLEEGIFGKFTGINRHIFDMQKQKRRKISLISNINRDKVNYNQGAMQRMNQGHKR